MIANAAAIIGQRPNTAHNHGTPASPVKAVRYEEAAPGVLPLPVASVGQHTRSLRSPRETPTTPATTGTLSEPVGDNRPKTAPSTRASQLSHDFKRDSGIAASTTTGHRESYAESQQSSAGAVLERIPSLPAIVVQDEEKPAINRSRSPFGRKSSKERQPKSNPDLRSAGIQRFKSFRGIQTSIPKGDLEELDSNKIDFSQRGSLLFGGKKMQEVIEAQGMMTGEENHQEPDGELHNEGPQEVKSDGVISEPQTPTDDTKTPRPLVAGRRKPSVQMLQAAIQGGRVLSAEEISFSLKVRSMYEHGDERAAVWTAPPTVASRHDTPESLPTDRSTPDVSDGDIVVPKTRDTDEQPHTREPERARASYYSKHPHEWAGGIEDWEDLDGADVDRYGFIVKSRRGTTSSSGVSQPSPREGIHRVATGLQTFANQPRGHRRPHRGHSVARSSRSVPARSESRNGTGSVRSVKSTASNTFRANPFRSKDRRITEAAGDMLTLPPGLADVERGQGTHTTVDVLQRREWTRSEKWLKMAHPVREHTDSPGGGMHFEFDTSDPKLVSRVWKGIPDRWRATAWHSFLSTSAKKRGNFTGDAELRAQYGKLQEMSSADDYQIDVDVPRTISMHIMFRRRYRGGQRLLFRVLHAISLHFPDTGYVQGMASLAATFLCYFDEENAFIMMVRLWQLRGLEQLFQNGFEGLLSALKEFEDDWLGGGDVAQKLEELGITATAYGTRWYLTLFNMSVPFPAQLRVWDVFMLLGDASPTASVGSRFGGADLDVLHATSAALIDATREIILDSDFENAMKVLTSFVPIRDEDLLMRVARVEYKMRKKRLGVRT